MYTSVLDKGGIFTEQRFSVNSFVTATSNNGYNSKPNLSTETEQRTPYGYADTQGLLIGVLIH